MTIRTRFAPSPTGYIHVGNIRTALFAWLVARQAEGQFILRIEDTDRARHVEGAEQHIIDSLKALGLTYDEGPDIGGLYAPYRQSERLENYKQWAQKLINAGRAYADPYTSEELQEFREAAQASKKPFLYRNHRPENPPHWDGTTPLRFRSDPKAYARVDAVMGELKTGPETIDDFILIKSDGYPTYNFAHIIDDTEMKVSHIIRGQEFLSSIPNYLNLYDALEIEYPIMATMPHIMAPDGKKKLGKRDGAKDVLDYIRQGILPEALVNFIATLGWNDGSEQEIFSIQQLIDKFELSRVQRGGARFDEQRLLWMNGTHIRSMAVDDLMLRSVGYWPKSSDSFDVHYRHQVLGLIQERLKYLAEIPELTNFFFEDLLVNPALINENKNLSKLSIHDIKDLLSQAKELLAQSDFSLDDLTSKLNELLVTTGQKPAVLFTLIRIATTQAPSSPSLAQTMTILGRDRSLRRIDTQLAAL